MALSYERALMVKLQDGSIVYFSEEIQKPQTLVVDFKLPFKYKMLAKARKLKETLAYMLMPELKKD